MINKGSWAAAPLPALGPTRTASFGGNRLQLSKDNLKQAASDSESAFDPSKHTDYRFAISIEQGYPDDPEEDIDDAREEGRVAGLRDGRTAGKAEGLKKGKEEGRLLGLKAGKAEGLVEGREQGRKAVLSKELPEALRAAALQQAERLAGSSFPSSMPLLMF